MQVVAGHSVLIQLGLSKLEEDNFSIIIWGLFHQPNTSLTLLLGSMSPFIRYFIKLLSRPSQLGQWRELCLSRRQCNTHLLHTELQDTDDHPSLLDGAICPRRSWVNVNMNPVDCVMCYHPNTAPFPVTG